MARIYLTYPIGDPTYAYFETDENGSFFSLGGQRYTVKDIADTGAVAIVSDPETLRKLTEAGMTCRPAAKQTLISISLQPDVKERLKEAAKATGKTMSSILASLAQNWLDENGF